MRIFINNLRDMDNTMLIEVTNQKAVGLLHELEELRWIKVLKENITALRKQSFPINIKEA